MRFDAVLFDAAETLFTTRGSVGEIYASVAAEYGTTASAEQIQAAFVKEFRNSGPVSSETEKEWWKNLVERVFHQVGMPRDFDAFFNRVYDVFRDDGAWLLFPETRDVLTSLTSLKLRLGIISNFDSRIYSVMRSLDILSYFDSITISSETGYAKPHPAIFAAAVRSLKTTPGRILVVGDSLSDDVQGAAESGLNAVLIDRRRRYNDLTAFPRIESLKEVVNLVQTG